MREKKSSGITITPSKLVDIDLTNATDDDVIVVIFDSQDRERLCLGVTSENGCLAQRLYVVPELAPDDVRLFARHVAQESIMHSRPEAIAQAIGVDSMVGLTPEGLLYELSLHYLQSGWIAGQFNQALGRRTPFNIGSEIVIHCNLLERKWDFNGGTHFEYTNKKPITDIVTSTLTDELLLAAARLPL